MKKQRFVDIASRDRNWSKTYRKKHASEKCSFINEFVHDQSSTRNSRYVRHAAIFHNYCESRFELRTPMTYLMRMTFFSQINKRLVKISRFFYKSCSCHFMFRFVTVFAFRQHCSIYDTYNVYNRLNTHNMNNSANEPNQPNTLSHFLKCAVCVL